MSTFSAKPKEVTWEAKVFRADGTVDEHGVIAYWHRNPLIRWFRCWKYGVPRG